MCFKSSKTPKERLVKEYGWKKGNDKKWRFFKREEKRETIGLKENKGTFLRLK